MSKSVYFPDGTLIDSWFYYLDKDTNIKSGPEYVITDYGIKDDGAIYTKAFQSLIDLCATNGGGTIVVPHGTYFTGSIFFKQNVNLFIEDGGVLKGSDDICDYPVVQTRIEGESVKYFAALINADGIDGFSITGKGTIDGNGLKSWKAFWLRRSWNPDCTNKDEQRPRLVYISNCRNVFIKGITMQNSHFWTNHIYRSSFVKFIDCKILSPAFPVKSPSTDAIDIDACHDVLIDSCYMEVNDDAVALKGGKGVDADKDKTNGSNERIIISNCEYGFCHGCLTLGSESIHCKNIIMENIKVKEGFNLLWLKMRPDTPQHYEYVSINNISGKVDNFITVYPWTQFFDLKGHTLPPLSYCDHISMSNCDIKCDKFFNVKIDKSQYELSNFTLNNLVIAAKKPICRSKDIPGFVKRNVKISKID